MDPTTKAGRDALRAVAAAATPGEWVSGSVLDGRPAGSVYEDRLGGRVCALSSDADAALIAAARNAIIPALDRIDELEEKLREMTARALGHAYASSMAEGGEEIKAQELRRARADLEEVLAENRAYEQRALTAERERDEARALVKERDERIRNGMAAHSEERVARDFLARKADALEKALAVATEALSFYGDVTSWRGAYEPTSDSYYSPPAHDRGDRARAALVEIAAIREGKR